MARYENGINGSFHGKVGPTVGCSWKGVDYMRAAPKRRQLAPTPKQIAARATFAFVQKWLGTLSEVVTIGFKDYSPRMTARMAAHSYTYNHVLRGKHPGVYIDYTAVMISYGPLPGVENAMVQLQKPDIVAITWDTESTLSDSYAGDVLFYLLYNRTTDEALHGIGIGTRSDGLLEIEIPESYINQEIEVYLAFKSLKTNSVSMSQYLGNVKINF